MAYDLLASPWIPCAQGTRRPVPLSLREVLAQAHEMDDIANQSPLVLAGLYRVLLAILHRAYQGPGSPGEWRALWRRPRLDMEPVERYWRETGDRWDLLGTVYPWMQTGNLPAAIKPRSVLSLGHEYKASGATAQMFGGRAPEAITPAYAARLLAAFQPFALGGTLSREKGDPNPSAKAGPLTKAAMVVAKGATLRETLLLNLVRYEHREDDRPAWERGGAAASERRADGWVDLATWNSRRICLLPPEALDERQMVRHVQIARGWESPAADTLRSLEAMVAWRLSQKREWYPLALTTDHAVWRDLTALLAATETSHPPRNLSWLAELVAGGHLEAMPRHVEVLGAATDRFKVLLRRRERLALPLPGRAPAVVEAMRLATGAAGALRRRLTEMHGEAVDPDDYWASLDEPFRAWTAGTDDLDEWRLVVARHAWAAFHRHAREVAVELPVQVVAERRFGVALHAEMTEEKSDA